MLEVFWGSRFRILGLGPQVAVCVGLVSDGAWLSAWTQGLSGVFACRLRESLFWHRPSVPASNSHGKSCKGVAIAKDIIFFGFLKSQW